MAANGVLAHPPFQIDELDKTDINEDRFRVTLTNSGTHYYIAINTTVMAVWRGEAQTPAIEIARQVADHLNVLRGDPPVLQGNCRFTEANTAEEDDPPRIRELADLLDTSLAYIGGSVGPYEDDRTGLYD